MSEAARKILLRKAKAAREKVEKENPEAAQRIKNAIDLELKEIKQRRKNND